MKFTLTISHEQMLILDRALRELPEVRFVADLNEQIKSQMTPQVVPDAETTPAVPQTEAKAA